MKAILTKWQKNSSDSIPWPSTLNFIDLYSETNLPTGFTSVEYSAFLAYIDKLSKDTLDFNILINRTVNDIDGNIINTRVFIDDTEFATFQSMIDESEADRNALLAMFNLTRTVKVFTDDDTIIKLIDDTTSYEDLNALITA